MKTLEYGKHKSLFPEKLEELTESQLLEMASVFTSNKNLIDSKVWLAYTWATKIFDYNENRIKTILKKIKASSKAAEKETLQQELEDCHYNRSHLADLSDWITTQQICDKWIIEKLNLPEEFAGPSLRFGNIQFWEWCLAEELFSQYIQNDSREAFNKFCACIYHPIVKDERVPFNDTLVSANYKLFENLTPTQVFAIRLNYIAVKNWLRQEHKHLFKLRSQTPEEADKEDMADLLLRHADAQKVHYKIVEKDPVLVALKQLNIRAKDAQEKEDNNND